MALAVGVSHVGWLRAADGMRAEPTPPATGSQDPTGADNEEERARAATEKRYRAEGRPPRAGTTVLRIAPDDNVWRATADHEVSLRPSDSMIADLRTGTQTLQGWLPFQLRLGAGTKDCEGTVFNGISDDGRLAQRSPSSQVQASFEEWASWVENDDAVECIDGYAVITLIGTEGRLGGAGIYDTWTLTLDVPKRPILRIMGGTTLRQDAHHAELRVPEGRQKVTLVLGEPVERAAPDAPVRVDEQSDVEHLSALLQRETPLREAIWLAAALVAVSVCWVLPFVRRWSPPGSRRQWTTVAVTSCALTAALLLYGLAGSDAVPWPTWLYPARGSALALWSWALLPFLLAAFAVRLATGRPPRLRELLPMLIPSLALPALAVLVTTVEGTRWPLLSLGAVALTTVGVVVVLKRGLLGATGRRWTPVAAGAVWLTVLGVGPGLGVVTPDNASGWGNLNSLVVMVLAWGWEALALFVVALEARRVWLVRVGWVLLVVYSFLPVLIHNGFRIWGQGADDTWVLIGLYPTVAASYYPGTVLYLAFAIALWCLWMHGKRHQGWPSQVRTIAVGLGIAGAATGLAAYGFSMFGDLEAQRGGYYAALLVGAAGFAWLLPPSAETRAVRLHNTRPAAHNRLVHALLKDQALAAGRREFLSSSRTALAEGELTARQWSARWRHLGALGERGTAPQHSVNLRLAALGTSGGRTALRNGLAAAVLLAALCVPWMLYTVPTPLSADDPRDEQVWTYALRWAVYGFVYGYAYSWIRGGSPIGKALSLLAVVLPVELAQLLYRGLTPEDFAVSLLLTTGNCLAVFLVLGLYWEARLVRVAGLRWGQIRNFRSLSATAVPVTTVLVASATALATAMVGAWIAPESNPTPTNPGAGASVSAEPSPSP
ncbi:hypothetical protein HLK59_32640 [Streptomyces sp. S3(2020)]|uniref:hypothetical protein n=1 Tax=Streptomyces sp. S3(2020) TaxID=2732044 RepID=UPI001489B0C5|nr:hypothetical protein [Streptomyces sp. S3(2020)]NNN35030.1 hypothetical protein [Streptomyces sp. S3(2020)]